MTRAVFDHSPYVYLFIIHVFDQRGTEIFDWQNEFIFDGGGRNGVFEAKFLCFGDATIWCNDAANFPAQANFAKDDDFFVQFTTSGSTGDSHTNG